MIRFVLGVNSLLFHPGLGTERVAAGLLLAAAFAGPAHSAGGITNCLAAAILLLSRPADKRRWS